MHVQLLLWKAPCELDTGHATFKVCLRKLVTSVVAMDLVEEFLEIGKDVTQLDIQKLSSPSRNFKVIFLESLSDLFRD